MATAYGSDFTTFVGGRPDIDPRFMLIETSRVVAETCARRLLTPRGSLVGDPDFGFDLRDYLGARITNVQRARIVSGVEEEMRKDERVARARVVEFRLPTAAVPTLRLKVAIETASDRLEFVLSIDRVSAEVLIG
jgi:phage baseplate assembly protein W